MIEDMHAVMRRIHEIQSRFGLIRRQPPQVRTEAPPQDTGFAGSGQVGGGFTGATPRGTNEVERAIDYLIGGGEGSGAPSIRGGDPISRGIRGLSGDAGGTPQGFLRTLMGTITGGSEPEND